MFAKTAKLGYIEGKKYNLAFRRLDKKQIFDMAAKALESNNTKYLQEQRDIFIKDHIDVTKFMVNTILNVKS